MTIIAALFWTAAFLGAAAALVSALRHDGAGPDAPPRSHHEDAQFLPPARR
ncbi:hypothetical protein [Nocardioides nanhaiensis]|uniref:Uncharacterized protein n=1 Tax=Nocardioides nanhaiensis TaxID=1476871 RepID=A0ABP8WZX8_9ACTN